MDIKNFFLNYKDIVTKPLYGNGGEGIFRYSNIEKNSVLLTIKYIPN